MVTSMIVLFESFGDCSLLTRFFEDKQHKFSSNVINTKLFHATVFQLFNSSNEAEPRIEPDSRVWYRSWKLEASVSY